MRWKSIAILIFFVVITISCNFTLAKCPSADLTGDCFVDFEDFAIMAAQWLTDEPNFPVGLAYIPLGVSRGEIPSRTVRRITPLTPAIPHMM